MAGCLVAAALIAWFLRVQLAARSFDWKLFAGSVSGLRWSWLLLALLPAAGTYYGRALRWAVFLKPLKPRPSISNLMTATLIGFTALTLFGRAGDFVRPYLISVKEKVPLTSQLASWVLERIFDLLMATLVLGFGLTRLQASGIPLGPGLAWVLHFGGQLVGGSCLAVLIMILSMRHFAEPVRRRLIAALRFLPEARYRKFEALITAFFQGVESTRSDGALLLVLAYSILEWGLIAACYWCLAQAFVGIIDLTLVDILIFMGFVSFGGVIQIPGIGGGTQVSAVFILTELFGIRLELATLFALLVWILTFVAVVPVGLGLALKEGLDWHSLRRIGREVSK
ncbi:MAG TPA: lysylphosphatidylglycerol synthase transmembrane domain-containing protein [Bryobacteraceae bacterium]